MLSVKEICVRAGAANKQDQLMRFDAINQQPIGLNMTFTIGFHIAGQRMVPVSRRKLLPGQQGINNCF